MDRTAVGYFPTRAAADRAYEELDRAGFDRDDLSVIGPGAEGGKGLMDKDDHVSGAEGAAVGGIAGLLIGVGAMLIPGIGPIVAVGPLTAALTGAVTGGVTGAVVGGIAGALIDAGVPEEEARWYEGRFRQGGYLVTVRTDDDHYARARSVLESCGAETSGRNVQAIGREALDTDTPTTERRTVI
jgi:hypothetical protein